MTKRPAPGGRPGPVCAPDIPDLPGICGRERCKVKLMVGSGAISDTGPGRSMLLSDQPGAQSRGTGRGYRADPVKIDWSRPAQ
jgi:hypothetical protein